MVVQRNLKVPAFRNRLLVDSFGDRAVFLLHLPEYAVTVCWHWVGFFHTILSPLVMRLAPGSQCGSPAQPFALNRDVSPSDEGATRITESAATAVAATHLRVVMCVLPLATGAYTGNTGEPVPGIAPIPEGSGDVLLMWPLSDESLLAGMSSGDPDAAAAFVRRYQARVFGLALSILADRAAAEEVAQETFLRAWRHGASYDARRGRVSTWLLTIARNLAVDATRLRRVRPLDPLTLVALCEGGQEGEAEDPYVAADETRRLRRALADLPVEQKLALVQAAFYGRTAREISEAEGVPLGTVKTRIRAAMLKLRSVLEPDR